MSSINVSNLAGPSGTGTAATLASINGGPISGARNRIINGDMRIDQRNAGAAVTITNTSAITYTIDRWAAYGWQASKFSVQQNAGSVTPPTGFTNYLGVTSLSAYTVGSGETFYLRHAIEGFNFADFGWGAAGAVSATLSFWVRSSLTGTFSGSATNGSNNRSYPFTFSITSANTWEQKTVTIPGDTTGTWAKDNTAGFNLFINLGSGSTFSASAGSWQAGDFRAASGSVSLVGTNGATFYLTGVQLEAGTVATPFERRSYGQELALCQRYYQAGTARLSIPAQSSIQTALNSQKYWWHAIPLPVTMRTTPTTGPEGTNTLTGSDYSNQSLNLQWGFSLSNQLVLKVDWPNGGNFSTPYTASAEL